MLVYKDCIRPPFVRYGFLDAIMNILHLNCRTIPAIIAQSDSV